MQKGFTILEMSCVIAVIGILTALAVPTYDGFVRRARTDEARTTVEAIAHAEQRAFRDRGAYLPCPATGAVPQGPGHFPSDDSCWRALGVRNEGEVRYRYSVALEGSSFVVLAEGDLDKDGITSRFSLHGSTLSLEIQDELE